MKFMIGYQLPEDDEESIVEIVRDYLPHVAEVYFPWLDSPSGRAPLTRRRGYADWTGQAHLEADLRAFREMGLKLDLLFNANCYGRHAVSQYLENQVVSVMHHLEDVAGGADAVTTTSPAVASTLKRNFPRVEVRASVNMRIGTVQAMRYLADLFDGFYVQRECNRDLARLGELKASADGEGKRLYLLANSGCLAFCPAQTFHDNLVAHESDVDETVNIPGFHPHLCWNLYADRANWPAILQACWIRPEDLHHYERLFDLVKLATRMHARPRSVLDAYGRRRWRGNLLELFEPGFAPAFAGWLLDNDRFPPDWFARTSACDRRCERCGYCAEVLDQVLVRADDGVAATIRTPNST